MKKILAINGSASTKGANHQLLEVIADDFSLQYSIAVYSKLNKLPLFTPEKLKAGVPDKVAELKSSIVDSDAIIFCTPEYLHNIPAVLKNALEWLTESGELAEKSVLPITFTPSPPRGGYAMKSLVQSLKASKAKIAAELPLYQNELRNENGEIQLDTEYEFIIQEALSLL